MRKAHVSPAREDPESGVVLRVSFFTVLAVLAAYLGVTQIIPSLLPPPEQALARIRTYYKEESIGPDKGPPWKVKSVTADGRNLRVAVVIPEAQMKAIRTEKGKFPIVSRRKRVARTACPPWKNEIWKLLNKHQDIVINAGRGKNDLLVSGLSCREWGE